MVLEKILCTKMIIYSLKPFNTNIQYTFDISSICFKNRYVKGKSSIDERKCVCYYLIDNEFPYNEFLKKLCGRKDAKSYENNSSRGPDFKPF